MTKDDVMFVESALYAIISDLEMHRNDKSERHHVKQINIFSPTHQDTYDRIVDRAEYLDLTIEQAEADIRAFIADCQEKAGVAHA